MQWRKLLFLFRRDRFDRDLAEEMRSHVEFRAERLRRQGLADAETLAKRAFGNTTHLRETSRDAWTWRWLEEFARDIAYALRTLRCELLFTSVVATCLAAGIGGATAFFSILRHVVVRPFPYRDSGRLAIAWSLDRRLADGNAPVSFPDWQDWRSRNHTFTALAAFRNHPGFVPRNDGAIEMELHEVSADFLPLLGVPPILGGFWTERSDPSTQSVVISYAVWQAAFGGARDVIGRTLVIQQTAYTVSGVMPASFRSPSVTAGSSIGLSPPLSVWTPFVPNRAQRQYRANRGMRILARLAPGSDLAAGAHDLRTIADSIAAAEPKTNRGISARLVPLSESIAGAARRPLLALMGAALLFFLVSCANVTSLMAARATVRIPEFVARAWLGAGRIRLIRQLLTESLVLAMFAGAAGLLLAALLLAAARQAAFLLDVPRLSESVCDWPTMLAALALSVVSGVACSLFPALRLSKADTAPRAATLQRTAGRGAMAMRRLLVAGQAAVSLVLISSASLLMLSFSRLAQSHGIQAPERIFTFQSTLSGTAWNRPPLDRQFYQTFLDRLRHLPGVESAALTTRLLQIGDPSSTDVFVDGQPPPSPERVQLAGYTMADGAFFGLANLPLRAGRLFDDRDGADAPRVIVVNDAFTRAVLGDRPPVGARIHASGVAAEPLEIVGVVRDTAPFELGAAERPRLFYPSSQQTSSRFIAMVRMASGVAPPAAAIREILRGYDSRLPLFAPQTAAELLGRATARPRWGFVMVASFAAIAFLLANIGVGGAVAFLVARRTRECGIRIALGADPLTLARKLAAQGVAPAAIGLAVGMAGALAAGRALDAYLFGISGRDPWVLAGAAATFLGCAAVAAWLPARRAARVDPAAALRSE